MHEIFDTVATFDQYTIVVIGVIVCVTAALAREITGSTFLAVIAAPIMFLGALMANYIFRTEFVIAAADKDTNIVIATAIGVLCALVLLLGSIWIAVLVSERRSTRRKFMRLPDVPPPGR
jgi:hypothetical protein